MAAEGRLEILAMLKDKASGALRKIRGLAGGIGDALKKGALVGGAAIVGLGVLAIKTFAGFDDAMTKSLAIMGDVETGMRDQLEQAARDVAKTTTFSAQEAAEAYFFLASAGLDAAQSIEALPKVAAFAQAGNFDLALATDLLTDSQSALGLTADDTAQNIENMARVSDVLIKANTLSNATAQQFSESLTNKAGPALRAVNKDIEEGVAVLAVFADQGIKGSEAGTQLAIVLRDLQTKALLNKDEFAALNISVFDSEGNMRNMADIVGDLEGALDGMSDAQAKATLLQLGFSDKSISSLQALLGQSDAIREYQTELEKAGGITDEVANKQLESFTAQLSLLKSGFEDVLITLGGLLVPLLLKLFPLFSTGAEAVQGFIGSFERFNDPDITSKGPFGFGERLFVLFRTKIFPALKDVADFVVNDFFPAFKSGAEVVGPIIQDLFNFIVSNKPALIAAITAIGVAILLALGPGAIAVAAIVGLIVLIGLVRDNFDSWKATVLEFVDAVIAKVEGIPVLGEIFKATVRVIGDKIEALIGFIQGLIDFVGELVRFVKAIIEGDWAAAWEALKNLAEIALNLFLDFLDLTFIGTIRSILEALNVWDMVKGAFNTVKDKMIEAFNLAKAGILGAMRSVETELGLIMGRIELLVKGSVNLVIGIMNGWIGGWQTALNAIISGINAIPDISTPFGSIGIPHVSPVFLPRIPTLEHGGRVLQTGLAVVHEDEEFRRGGFGPALVIENLHLGVGVTRRTVSDFLDIVETEQAARRRRGR